MAASARPAMAVTTMATPTLKEEGMRALPPPPEPALASARKRIRLRPSPARKISGINKKAAAAFVSSAGTCEMTVMPSRLLTPEFLNTITKLGNTPLFLSSLSCFLRGALSLSHGIK